MIYHWTLSKEFLKKKTPLIILTFVFWIWTILRQYPFNAQVMNTTIMDYICSSKSIHMDGWAMVELCFPVFLLMSLLSFLCQSGKRESLGMQPILMYGNRRKWAVDELLAEIIRNELIICIMYVLFAGLCLMKGIRCSFEVSTYTENLLQGEKVLSTSKSVLCLEFFLGPIIWCFLLTSIQIGIGIVFSPVISLLWTFLMIMLHQHVLARLSFLGLMGFGMVLLVILCFLGDIKVRRKELLQ